MLDNLFGEMRGEISPEEEEDLARQLAQDNAQYVTYLALPTSTKRLSVSRKY